MSASGGCMLCLGAILLAAGIIAVFFGLSVPYRAFYTNENIGWVPVALFCYYLFLLFYVLLSSIIAFCGPLFIGKWYCIKRSFIPLIVALYTLIPTFLTGLGVYMSRTMIVHDGIYKNDSLSCWILTLNMYICLIFFVLRIVFAKKINSKRLPMYAWLENRPVDTEPATVSCSNVIFMALIDPCTANQLNKLKREEAVQV